MFDVDQRDDVLAVADLGRSLAEDLLDPAAKQAEADGVVSDAVLDALHATGLTVPVPEEHGGGGVPSCAAHLAFVEALAHGDPAIALAACWPGAAALLIDAIGTDAQRAALLPRLVAPRPVSTVALTEGFGRAPSEAATSIAPGPDGVRVRGQKLGVPGAVGADPLVVVGVDPTDGRIRVVALADGTAARVEPPAGRLGLRAARLSSVDVDGTVDALALLGGPDADPDATALTLARIRLITAAVSVGSARRAVAYASRYATERTAFGKPIAAFQASRSSWPMRRSGSARPSSRSWTPHGGSTVASQLGSRRS